MSNTLLPCPFCGGGAELREWSSGTHYYRVECVDLEYCDCHGVSYSTAEEAIAAWNRRAQPENEPLVRCGECIVPIADCPCVMCNAETDFPVLAAQPERSEGAKMKYRKKPWLLRISSGVERWLLIAYGRNNGNKV